MSDPRAHRRRGVVAALLLALALTPALSTCATVPEPPPPPPPASLPSTTALASMDWHKAGDEAFDALRGYLMVPTVNPPGDEKLGAEFLAALLAQDGIEAEIDAFSRELPNRANLYARLKADAPKQPPLCLVSHIDVVTAEPDRWPKGRGPFEGTVAKGKDGDDVLWGRGALDMKSLGLLEVQALRWLKRLGVRLERDVIVVAVADEEVGSDGMLHVVNRRWQDFGCSHAINEGGLGLSSALADGQTLFGVSVAEKGFVWLRIVAEGNPGHGSTPVVRAPQRLLEAINKIEARKPTPRVHPSLYELLAASGREQGGLLGFVLERPALVDSVAMGTLLEEPATRALVTDTMNLTGFSGAKEPNVVPSSVYAQYDARLLPGTTPESVIAAVEAAVAEVPGVRVEVIDKKAAAESAWDDPLYRALTHHAVDVAARDGIERIVVGPLLSPGFTDSILLRDKGVRAYGFVPIVVDRAEAGTMHGDGERISRRNVRRGLETLLRAVVDVSAAR